MNDLFDWLFKFLEVVWKVTWRFAQQRPWAVAVALFGLARAFGIMIQSGQRGVLFRWGRAVKELEPGYHWLVPMVHGVKTTPVRSITLDLPVQKVFTADGLVYDVSVNVVYHVENATKALTMVEHVAIGCRDTVPILVTEVLCVRDQAHLADRLTLDRELTERVQTWVARWGLAVEQAGFTSIAPNKGVLRTTQLSEKTVERARVLRLLIDEGLDIESALVMIGTEHPPIARSSLRYQVRSRGMIKTNGGFGRWNLIPS